MPKSSLVQGLQERFENMYDISQEIQDGTLVVPAVDNDGLLEALLVASHANKKLCVLMADKVYLHNSCYVSVTANDTEEDVEDGSLIVMGCS
jgi:hypothetical protein